MAESAVIQAVVGKPVEKLVEYSLDSIKKQLRYLCCYSCNVQTLADEVEELNIKRQSLQQRVNAALANSNDITREVETWLKKVEDLKTRSDRIRGDAEEVKRSCLCKWFPVLHYSLSRKAWKTTNDSVQLRNIEFREISTPVLPANIPPVPNTSIVGFESRDSLEDKIVDALKDPSVYSIGIWGLGGVGKTVMAEKIEKRVRDEKLFEHVVMVVVSQQADIPKIQSHIAEGLGLPLSEDSPVSRQRKLHQRLMAEKGILIILDDLWERLNLEEFGIPSQSTHAGCKLILTSRNRDTLTFTGVQKFFQLQILNEEDSWRFFKVNIGINVDDDFPDDLVQIAMKVVRECKGLPLALKTVAYALKGKERFFWNNAVQELEKHVPDNIPGVIRDVYGSLQFSINALEGKEQKYLFLLCCLFPEDHYISIEELLRCRMGLGIFKELENLTEARDKVKAMLDILLTRSLLMKGDEKRESFNVRVHDVIRDVGIWIATEEGMEKRIFLIKHGLNKWPEVKENCNFISFLFSDYSIILPDTIVCPKLEFLRLDFVRRSTNYYVELPKNFLSGMGGLRVLEALHIQSLPQSIGQLNNLCTLSLQECKIFETISVLGKLINLEMLSLRECEFKVLPKEIGGLKKLKQMDISSCESLTRIAFGVVSGLIRLEELVIWDSFNNWEAEGKGEEDVACLYELNDLKDLTTLKIEIRNPSVVPRQTPLWVQKLKNYGIIVSKCNFDHEKVRFQKAILLGKEIANPLEDWIYDMASDSEYVNLEGCNCKKFVKGLSENSGNLSCLKQLRLSHFTNIQYLVEGLQNSAIFIALESLHIEDSVTLEQIFEVSPKTRSFMALQRIYLIKLYGLVCLWKFSIKEQLYLHNLQMVKIDDCDNLSYLFPLFVTQSLVQLSSLEVKNCRTIKEIFKGEDGELMEINEIKLPKLRNIQFGKLDSFYGLCSEIDRIELPELCELTLDNLPRIKMSEGDNNEVHQKYLISKVDNVQVIGISFNFRVLQDLRVRGITNFKCMFSPSVIIGQLPNLKYLHVEDCSMLEEVIGKDDENVGTTIIFPNLINLFLSNLPNIHTFCYNAIQFPSLRWLSISNCPLMLKFIEGLTDHISNLRPFLDKQVQCPKLSRLNLDELNISRVIEKDEDKNVGGAIIFPHLMYLSLSNLPNIRSFCCDAIQFPSLVDLCVSKCPLMLNFVEEFTDHISNSRPFIDNQVQCPKLLSLTMYGLNISTVFSPLFFKSLTTLTSLDIWDCEELKHIIAQIATNTKVIEKDEEKNVGGSIIFPHLKNLHLSNLPNIRSFCCDAIQFPSLRQFNVSKCPLMLNFVEEFTDRISNSRLFFDNQVQCPKLEILKLDGLNISRVIEKDEEKNVGGSIIFPHLKDLQLSNLPNIRSFCCDAIQFPSLRQFNVSKCPLMLNFVEEFTDRISNSRPLFDNQVQCPKLTELTLKSLNISGVFSPLFFKSLTVLRKLALKSCEELEHLIFKEERQTAEGEFIQMVPLKTFYLIKMPKLYGSVFQMKHSMKFPSLEEIIIEDCPTLEKFSIGSSHLSNLKSVSGLQSAESVANFFSYKEIFPCEIHLENKCFIISHKDISFNSNMVLHFFRSDSSESFVDVVSHAALVDEDKRYEIVGKFEIENIRMGIEYEVILMILLLHDIWNSSLEIRLKLPEGSELQRTETHTQDYQRDTLIEIPIGKFVGESQQSKQLEFSLSAPYLGWSDRKILSIKGVKIMEV